MNFQGIFERHFFSNHHVEAQRLEARLEQLFVGHECVTFSSLSALLATALDELCDAGVTVHANWDEPRLHAINSLFGASGRQAVQDWSAATEAATERVRICLPVALGACIHAVLLRQGEVAGLLLDLSGYSSLLRSAAVFVTQDAVLAEKVRWARSSYGRRAPASIGVAANGRFSEFQAHLLNAAFDEAGYAG